MRLLIILSLIGVSLTSPIVKRTKERLIYGNQQNGPKIKKSDPNMAVLPDLHGDVQALDAKDIETNTDDQNKVIDSKDDSKAIEKELIDQVMTEEKENTDDDNNNNEENTSENTENESTDQVDQTENNDVDNAKFSETAMAEITPEQENSIEELEKVSENSETENSAETDDKEPTNDATEINTDENKIKIPNEWYQPPLDLYKNYQNDYYSNYPEDFLSYYDLLGRKRRMARRRATRPIDAPVKRSRRIKRDLPDEILYDPYYLSGAEYPVTTYEDDLEEPYVYSPDDNIEAYLELLEEANKADPRLMETEELVPTFDMAKRVVYNGEPGYFVPVKRQSYSFENKRDQYFYPFAEEPRTHFSAFVPQKRDYADTYESLLRLARTLGRADREDSGYQWQSKK